MYRARALYTPDVPFVNGDMVTLCDVLTCAAPNLGAGLRYGSFGSLENLGALKRCINFLLSVAAASCCDTIILGASGCGAFLCGGAAVQLPWMLQECGVRHSCVQWVELQDL